MRKFTLFLMSLFLSVGAMAQIVNGNMYRIKNSDGTYMNVKNHNWADGSCGGVNVAASSDSNGQIFTFIQSGDGYKLKSGDGYYIKCHQWNVNASTTNESEASVLLFEEVEGDMQYLIKWANTYSSNQTQYFKVGPDNNGAGNHPYCDAARGDAATWTLENVILPEYTVTYNYKHGNVLVCSMSYTVLKGSEFPALVSGKYNVTVNGSKPTGTVQEDGEYDIDVTIGEMPFEYYVSIADVNAANGWYNLVMHSNQGSGKYRTYLGAGDATKLAWGEMHSMKNPTDDYYWAFVGDPINGFRVVNKGKGEGCILSSNGDANPTMLQEDNLADGYNTTWTIAARTSNGGNDWVAEGDWFCLKYRNAWYMNANAANGTVNFWNSDDNGSGILAVKPLEINAAADIATYFSEAAISIPAELGAEVYYANGINEAGYMGLEQITGIVYPETGIVVRYATDVNVTFAPEIVSPGTATAPQGNLLKGTTKKTLITKESGKAYYALGLVEGEVGFYNAANGENTTEFYNNAFKAYLEMPASSGTAAFYGFDWEGTTGISEVKGESGEVKTIYDLTGRRIEAITAPGIYIVGGKKVLVK